jgi:hypothetical protein
VKATSQRGVSEFPLREEVEDFSGKLRKFIINCHESGLGFTVRAEEEGAEGMGYEFAAYSETSPFSALSRVRQKMYRGLATRHITGQPGERRMLHSELRGRITSDGHGRAAVIVDGIPLGIDDLDLFLRSHEGWALELRIVDALQ